MTKNVIFLVSVLLLSFAYEAFAKNITVGWTIEPGTSKDEWATGIASSVDGSLYLTGITYGSLNGETNAYAYLTSIFVMKVQSTGSIVWTKIFGSNTARSATSIAVSADGLFVFITGCIRKTCGDDCGDLLLTHKLSTSDGSVVWAITTETVQNDATNEETMGMGIAVTPDGSSVLVAGYTNDILGVGSTNAGSEDIIIVKYDSSDGTVLWTNQNGYTNTDKANSIAVSGDGLYSYATGMTFGNLNGETAIGGWDMFLQKYDMDGNRLWTRLQGSIMSAGPNGNDFANSVTVSVDGSIYVTGQCSGSLNGQPHVGSYDIFLLKFDDTGLVHWTRQMGTRNNEAKSYSVSVDYSGANISIGASAAGGFHNQGYRYSTQMAQRMAMIQYTSNGDHLATRLFGASGWSMARGITTLPNGNVYVGGESTSLGYGLNGAPNHDGRDIVVVEFLPLGSLPTAVPTLSPLSPSLRPTLKPTLRPSNVPSNVPNEVPSAAPSQLPSAAPSQLPSAAIPLAASPQSDGKKHSVVLPAVLGAIGGLLCCIFCCCLYRKRRAEKVSVEKV